jgi:hypothetical protein
MVDSTDLAQVLHEANDIAQSTAQKLTSAHVLLALFTVENRAQLLLKEKHVDEDSLLERMTSQPSEQDGLVRELCMRAREIAQSSGAREADCLHLLVAVTRVRCAASELLAKTGLHLINLGNTALSYCLSGSMPRQFQSVRWATILATPHPPRPTGAPPSVPPAAAIAAVSMPRPTLAPSRPPSRPALSPRDLIDEVNEGDALGPPEPTAMPAPPPPIKQEENAPSPELKSTPPEKPQASSEPPSLSPTEQVENNTQPKMTTDEIEILELIWTEFKEHGDWPRRKQMWKQLRSLGKDLETFAAKAQWMWVKDRVSVRFETLLALPEVRDILAPLPRFMRFMFHRFVEQPNLQEEWKSRGPEVKASEFFEIWGEETRARLALRLIEQFLQWSTHMSGTHTAEFSFQPELRILKYEHVETLEQFLAASHSPERGSVRNEPQGSHLQLLQLVYTSIRETGRWPRLVEFTLKHRSQLGYIPDLVGELSPMFIRKQQADERPPKIRLTAHALPYVAEGTGCALAASIVRNLMELLSDTESDQGTFSIEQIATKLKLPVERVRPVAMLLENEPWGSFANWRQGDSSWSIHVSDNSLWEYRDVQTWEQYIKIRNKHSPQQIPASLGVAVNARPHPADLTLQLEGGLRAPAIVGASATPPQEPRLQNRPGAKPAQPRPKVFIGHGHSKDWMTLRDFLRDKLHLEPLEFNSTPAAGQHTAERLRQLLDECALAFLVMTAEDEKPDGSWHARANVIHEIGLFQGRLGFEKTIILREERCSAFSNIAGLGYIEFPPGKIKACFEEIRDALSKLLPARAGT